jgi:spore maturation protein CgeB
VNIFVFGSSILSSYWNGAATYYRGIYKYLARRGHSITFAEPDAYGRQEHRDSGDYSYVSSIVYKPCVDVDRMLAQSARADVVIKHSGLGADDALLESRIPELQTRSAVIFWDVDAPATIERLLADEHDPLHMAIPRYDAIFTYGGGPAIRDAYLRLGARAYHSIYNGLDPETHHPVPPDPKFSCDLLFLGNRLPDRERRVEELFLRAAEMAPGKRFALGGEGWSDKAIPPNVRRIGHVGTEDHNRMNCSAGMVMNLNRSSMASTGFSPPTRVFEAAGAAVCMLCDDWPGLDEFFSSGSEILIVRSAQDVVDALENHGAAARRRIGDAFYARALAEHAYSRRAELAEQAFLACLRAKYVPAAVSRLAPTALVEESA